MFLKLLQSKEAAVWESTDWRDHMEINQKDQNWKDQLFKEKQRGQKVHQQMNQEHDPAQANRCCRILQNIQKPPPQQPLHLIHNS